MGGHSFVDDGADELDVLFDELCDKGDGDGFVFEGDVEDCAHGGACGFGVKGVGATEEDHGFDAGGEGSAHQGADVSGVHHADEDEELALFAFGAEEGVEVDLGQSAQQADDGAEGATLREFPDDVIGSDVDGATDAFELCEELALLFVRCFEEALGDENFLQGCAAAEGALDEAISFDGEELIEMAPTGGFDFLQDVDKTLPTSCV